MNDHVKARALCPVCGASTLINKGGKLRRHMRYAEPGWRMVACEGGGSDA